MVPSRLPPWTTQPLTSDQERGVTSPLASPSTPSLTPRAWCPAFRQFLVKDLTAAFMPQQGDPMLMTASL